MNIREIDVRSVMTKSNLPVADFAVNPYVGCSHACKYCYASFMKRFTNHPEPWGEFIDVKHWAPIRHPEKYAGKEAFLGSVTDCYQPCEARYGRTRQLLEQLRGSGVRISIATKSDLILRDLDLIRAFPDARVAFSINTLDEDFRREMDRGASIARRLEAMRQVHDAGIRTICFISPIFPGITNVRTIIERVRQQCDLVWLENLNLRGDFRPRILDWIHKKLPHLDDLYHEVYARRSPAYWVALDDKVREYTAREGMPYLRRLDAQGPPPGAGPTVINCFHDGGFSKKSTPSSGKTATSSGR